METQQPVVDGGMAKLDTAGVLLDLGSRLRQQTEASHAGHEDCVAQLGEECLALLQDLSERQRQEIELLSERTLHQLREVAIYNQLLLRYALTRWVAESLSRKPDQRYDARGQVTLSAQQGHSQKVL